MLLIIFISAAAICDCIGGVNSMSQQSVKGLEKGQFSSSP